MVGFYTGGNLRRAIACHTPRAGTPRAPVFFVAQGGAVALAANCNPGSSPTHAIPWAIALAVRFCGLTPAAALIAATVNGATVLGLRDRGTLAPGQCADVLEDASVR